MVLNQLHLVNFRNCSDLVLDFSSKVNLIVGPNAIGKTNILESIYLLATGNSFKAVKNEEMISWSSDLSLVEGKVNGDSLKISLSKENSRIAKNFWINKVKKTRRLFLESFLAVVFRPEEIRVVTGSPSRRREFLDQILSPLDWRYYQALLIYEKALRRRNLLLLKIAEREANVQELFYWDQTLVKNGELIRQKREEFFNFANLFFKDFQKGRLKHLFCRYWPSPITAELLNKKRQEELIKRTTIIGPHRDDFSIISSEFKVENANLGLWGSRGQQRLAVFALKLAQLNYIEEQKKEKPVLLLDDIFSELDRHSRELAVSLLGDYQSLVTALEEPKSLSLPFKTIELG
ncbi:DNA replication and repair protein RecF [Patescibacteria group bacterium]|nr:DNA replication and repair protein RecF [Patescibacteria group bacterium]